MKLTHKLFVASALMVMIVLSNARACSIQVMDEAQKNMLAAIAASHLDISLTQVNSTAISGYDVSFLGGEGASCPHHLVTEARVSFTYKPSLLQNCDAQVTVRRTQFIGEEFSFPLDSSEFSDATAACSTVVLEVKKPRKFPKPIPRPVPPLNL